MERLVENLRGVNFFGTDGIRGKTDTADLSYLEALSLFRKSAVITPSLIDLAVRAFVRLIGGDGSSVYVTGSDGRDSVTGNAFVNAMNNAFAANGATVCYLGVVPTPAVPQYQILNGCMGAAMLTASHNPSNQNGIKFFFNGKKLLPEGELGDLKVSSIMLDIALAEKSPKKSDGAVKAVDPAKMILDTLESSVPVKDMTGMHFILDTAAGAWTRFTDAFFKKNGLSYMRISEEEKGHNINRNCGVAEIEGHESYTRLQIPYAPRIIKTLFENTDSYGIVTDGDGDRGMLLKYDKASDTVKVYDGDEEAFLMMGLLSRERSFEGSHIVCTLESDIMSSVSFAQRFVCRSVITDVGDKWICNCNLSDLAIGFESSGHVIMPITLENGEILLSGNGLMTAAISAVALDKGISSFKRGYSKTFYTYFVNKMLFCQGSKLFEEDAAMLDKSLAEAIKDEKSLSARKRAFKDRNVLAYEIIRDGLTEALIVSRNSGTEDKNAVYLKCTPDLTAILEPVAKMLVSRHREAMRNENLPEMEIVRLILCSIDQSGCFTVSDAQQKDTMFTSVLHALEREGRIKGDGVRFVSA